MKVMIGYGVFQKPDMLRWMCEGIKENFPSDTPVMFYFEADNSNGEDIFSVMDIAERLKLNIFPPGASDYHLLEHGTHKLMIEYFMDTDCDCLIIPHDDNRFNAPLIPDLQKLWDKYGTNLGWISGRDGHGDGYSDMVCSPFSQSTGAKKQTLPIGDYREVKMMNTGPVVYFRHVIEKVGIPDQDMPWYWWSAYSLRCIDAGLTNILLSMDALHMKFGRCGNNPDLYSDVLVADGLKKLRERWGNVL